MVRMAVVQMCEHNGMVAVHVINDDFDIPNFEQDSVKEVLVDFFRLTWDDWIANRWRLEVVPTEDVRTRLQFCDLHSVTVGA